MMMVERFSRPGIMVLGIVAALILGPSCQRCRCRQAQLSGGRRPAGIDDVPAARGELPETAPPPAIQLRSRNQPSPAATRHRRTSRARLAGGVLMTLGGVRRERETLSGGQKCAVLCMALGTEHSAEGHAAAHPDGGRRSHARDRRTPERVARHRRRSAPRVPRIARAGIGGAGRRGYARQILEQALGARGQGDPRADSGTAHRTGLKRLRKRRPMCCSACSAASTRRRSRSSSPTSKRGRRRRVIEAMDTELAAEVLFRVARMEKASPEMLALIEAGLSSKADLSLSQEMSSRAAPPRSRACSTSRRRRWRRVSRGDRPRDPELTDQIKALMFVFEDLTLLDGRAMQRLLRDVDAKELALALKAASDELKQHILGTCRSARRRRSGRDRDLGPVQVKRRRGGAHADHSGGAVAGGSGRDRAGWQGAAMMSSPESAAGDGVADARSPAGSAGLGSRTVLPLDHGGEEA